MKIGVALVSLMAIFWLATGTLLKPPMVKTPLGVIEGTYSKGELIPVKQFLGVPYATPPLGKLRFLRPEPVKPWSGTYKANKQPHACMQYTEQPFPWYDNMTGKSEDCLYLNIYTPLRATKFSKFPVFFWIFGGGLTLGSNRLDVYDGTTLAKKEDLIVVTINYRLGLFGFFTSNSSDAPGNVGLYDMVMALQWVNDNIQYFGGDKKRITIAGESAGSISVSILCVSPLTKGLFSRAILESGSVTFYKYNGLGYNLNLGEKVAEAVGCATKDFTLYDHPEKVVQCLRSKNATYLTKTLWSFNPLSTSSLFPQYGDSLLPNNALDDLRNGNFNNVPILAGDVKNEGSFLLTSAFPDVFGFFGEKDPKINKTYGRTLIAGAFANFTNPQKYIDYYLNSVPDTDYYQIRKQVYEAYGDTIVECHTVYFAESYAKRQNKVYYYDFTHRPSNTPWAPWMGVAHFEEVQFVFGRPLRVPKDYDSKDIWVSKKVLKIWGDFARNGRPSLIPKWPLYSKKDHTYFTIDKDNYGKLGTGPHLKNCDFLRSFYGF
ncbi:acetylcholinesterase-1-like [Argiope bruennichi]|uniref:Carboxylic ester hydrolase n=1 Tax=Argiope bruennichi TaxID=94029 RepID=A0A8T0EEC5_ARGBR|nr:acetylcholinesterase-1-like [Argiope bruennichi]KAF8771442.1 Acetylcholinesterase-1 like protein [Argiope bruennichi]